MTDEFDDYEDEESRTVRCRRCADTFSIRGYESKYAPGERVICGPCEDARAREVPPLDVEAVFGPSGPLARPGFEVRPGQVQLSRAIFDALAQGGHLLAEGPCGIGKSKAYGVPAAWLASHSKRVLIVTESIALQEQLIGKDLPDLRRDLGWSFDFALLKGKGNYACKDQIEDVSEDGLGFEDVAELRKLLTWERGTTTGDRSEITFRPSAAAWGKVSIPSDECTGRKCGHYRDCYAYAAKNRAATAGIVVTNYHLFFLDMASGGQILPQADVVIFDEAHAAADVARDLLGFRISEGTIKRLATFAEKRLEPALGSELRLSASAFFAVLVRFHDSEHYKSFLRWPPPLEKTWSRLDAALENFHRRFADQPRADVAARVRQAVADAMTIRDANCVYSIDVGGQDPKRFASLVCRYVQPAPVLKEKLWPAFASVVAASATMTSDGDFRFARSELGVPDDAREIAVDSPFDFHRQALLIVPPSGSLPEPNAPEFVDVAARNVIETVEACGGRTLALFTSYRQLNAVYDQVRRHFNRRFSILKQGEMPTAQLIDVFRKDVSSVLLATTSFWTGIDVPGEALTGLVIDRLPFGSPDDPVSRRIADIDRQAFAHFTVPRSILTLRQGVGRLIRSQSDRGVVVILDRRLLTKPYGKRFLKSLPNMQTSQKTSAIEPFLNAQ